MTTKLRELTKPVSEKFVQEFGAEGAREMQAELEKILVHNPAKLFGFPD